MAYRSFLTETATWQASSSSMRAIIQPLRFHRTVKRIVIKGPARSVFVLYVGHVAVDSEALVRTGRGEANTFDASSPIEIPASQAALAVWSDGTTSATSTASIQMFYEYGEEL